MSTAQYNTLYSHTPVLPLRPLSLHLEPVQPLTSNLASRMLYSWAPVAHACNPSYLGGRDQEDRGRSQ
jgi:hypothetical protein